MSEAIARTPARRRMVVDGAVIVGSILLAFAIDAWWDGRKDDARGEVYLAMLAADVRQTLQNNATFGGRADSIDWAGARLVRAYYEAEPAPPDSIRQWFIRALAYWVVQPTLGTGEALVGTGDLRLIKDDSVRALLPTYINVMNAFDGFEQERSDDFRSSLDELRRHVDIDQLRLSELSATERDSLAAADDLYPLPAGKLRQLPEVDVQALVRDPEIHRILMGMNRAKDRLRLQRTRMREFSERFLELLESTRAQ